MLMLVFAAGMSSCIDEVDKDPIGNDEIYTDQNSLELLVGQTVKINASLEAAQFTWSSENPSIATVSAEGLVEGVSPGSVRITVKASGLQRNINVVVGSRKPTSATRFGNGLLLVWKSQSSPLLVGTELYYIDADSTVLKTLIPPSDSISLVPDYFSGLKISSVYCRPGSTDTMRVEPKEILVTNVSATVSQTSTALIDARYFDYGRDVGWHDDDAINTLGENYRSTLGETDCGVDMSLDGNVGDIRAGEWLIYTLNVKDEGLYLFDINIASRNQQEIELWVGDELFATMNIAGAGNIVYRWYYALHPSIQPSLLFNKGKHQLKLKFLRDGSEIKGIRIMPKSMFGGTTPVLQYTFDFPNDYSRPTIGDRPLRFFQDGRLLTPSEIADKVIPSPVAPDDEKAVTLTGGGEFHIPVPYDNDGEVPVYTAMWDVYTLNPAGDATFIHASNWSQNLWGPIYPDRTDFAPGMWMRMVFVCNRSDPATPIRKWYVNGREYSSSPGLDVLQGNGYIILPATWHVANIALWIGTALEEGQAISLGVAKKSSNGFGVYSGVLFGNGLLAAFMDRSTIRYTLKYIDTRGLEATMNVNAGMPNWVHIPNFGRNLRATPAGKDEIPFPDDKILDRRHAISSTGTTIIDAANFDAGGRGVGYNYTGSGSPDRDIRVRKLQYNEADCPVSVDYSFVNGGVTYHPIIDMANGTWFTYTVMVPQEGDYFYDLLWASSGADINYSLSVNGVDAQTYSCRNTNNTYLWYHESYPEEVIDKGGWPKIHLNAGYNTIRFNVLSGGSWGVLSRIGGFKFMPNLPPAKGADKVVKFGGGIMISLPDNVIHLYKLKYTNNSDQEVEISVSPLRKDTLLADFKTGLTATSLVTGEIVPVADADIIDKSVGFSGGVDRIIWQAVDFDAGGEGVGYHDDASRSGSVNYRFEQWGEADCGVDINRSPPTIGWTNGGEWLKYTINVETAGEYYFDVLCGVNNDMTFKLELNGTDLGDFQLKRWFGGTGNLKWNYDSNLNPYTPSFDPLQPLLNLQAGKNTLKFTINSGGIDYSHFKLIKKAGYPAVTAGTTDSRVVAANPTLYYAFTGTTSESLKQPNIGSVVLAVEQQSNPNLNPDPKEPIKLSHRPEWNPAPGRNAVLIGRNDQIKVLSPTGSTEAAPMAKYTMMWDVVRPAASWYGLLNAGALDRTTDATLFINDGGQVGRSSYSSFRLTPHKWHRIVMIFDGTDANGRILKVYVDGEHVVTSSSSSGRAEAYLKDWFWIFIDSYSNSTGEENDMYSAGYALWADRVLDETEIAALGSVVP
jgi:hypothetical protein